MWWKKLRNNLNCYYRTKKSIKVEGQTVKKGTLSRVGMSLKKAGFVCIKYAKPFHNLEQYVGLNYNDFDGS